MNTNTDITRPGQRTICPYCGAYADIIGQFGKPDHHTSARCVEGQEPIR